MAAVARISAVNIEREIVWGDETTYHYAALNILHNHTLVREISGDMFRGSVPLSPTAALSPGYPIYIAIIYKIFGESTKYVLISHVLLSIFSVWVIYKILLVLRASRLGICVSLLAVALYPGFLYSLDRMLTEQIFMLLFLLAVYNIFVGKEKGDFSSILLAGFFLGLATHVRAQAAPFFLVGIVFLAVYGGGFVDARRKVLIFSGGFLICMLPWWIRNYLTFHEIIFLTNGSLGPRIWGAVPYYLDMGATGAKDVSLSPLQAYQALADQNYLASPISFIRWKLFGFMNYMWADVWDENITHPGMLSQRISFFLQLFVVIPTLISAPWVLLKKIPSWSLIVSIPIIITILNLPFHGLPRYAYPAMPYVFIISALIFTRKIQIDGYFGGMNKIQSFLHNFGHYVLIFSSFIFSIWILYSVYIFHFHIPGDMSNYRLGKYAESSINTIEDSSYFYSKVFDISDVLIENGKIVDDDPRHFRNYPDLPGIVKADIPAESNKGVVTKVVINVKGGAYYDYLTVYWMDKSHTDFSENNVYRIPKYFFENSKELYIDGDVRKLMIVPSVLRGNDYFFNSIEIKKYSISNK